MHALSLIINGKNNQVCLTTNFADFLTDLQRRKFKRLDVPDSVDSENSENSSQQHNETMNPHNTLKMANP